MSLVGSTAVAPAPSDDLDSLPSAPSAANHASAIPPPMGPPPGLPPPVATNPPEGPSSAAPPADAAAARFKPGSKVIYSRTGEAGAGGVKGTVARLSTEGARLPHAC